MAARAPSPASPGPRNLAPFVAAWLRTQGCTATGQTLPSLALVNAHWLGSRGERFQFDYTWAGGLSRKPLPLSTSETPGVLRVA